MPDRYHHLKEDECLFAPLHRRAPVAEELVSRLEHQHVLVAQAMKDLDQLLEHWDAGGEPECAAFIRAARAFVDRYRDHMSLEEDELMPLAERCLTAEDWATAEAEFAKHHDLLKGAEESAELFRRILYLAPQPIGLGDPMQS